MDHEQLRERYAAQSTCTHPFLTPGVVAQARRDVYLFADSNRSWLECPDCGATGEADLNDDEQPILRDEPRGVPG